MQVKLRTLEKMWYTKGCDLLVSIFSRKYSGHDMWLMRKGLETFFFLPGYHPSCKRTQTTSQKFGLTLYCG